MPLKLKVQYSFRVTFLDIPSIWVYTGPELVKKVIKNRNFRGFAGGQKNFFFQKMKNGITFIGQYIQTLEGSR